ncbi:MAG: hypothetical protein ACREXU_03395, partial [Gammaproteobacteria bacterium]
VTQQTRRFHMPQMVMQRKFTVRSTKGHTIAFEKGAPVYVVPEMIEEVMTYGALPAEGEVLPVYEEPAEAPAPEGAAREQAVLDAIAKLVRANKRNDFGASGRPKSTAIMKLVGFDVAERERDTVWEKFTAQQAEKLNG